MQNEILSSADVQQDGEAADCLGCLSILLFPPFSTVLFGALLFFGLTRIPFPSLSHMDRGQSMGELAPIFTPQVLHWQSEIIEWSTDNNLDPNLVATVMQIESCGNPDAVSGAGATGLFQVMPYHFSQGENPYLPSINALRGLSYLKNSLQAFSGNIGLALAGYNGGINGASRPHAEWAQETIDYKYWGENIFADAAAGRQSSPALAEWLTAGGASLCAQAEQREAYAR